MVGEKHPVIAVTTDRGEALQSDVHDNALPVTSKSSLTLEMICPYPKAVGRKQTNKGRKIGKSGILTDTPEKKKKKKKKKEEEKLKRLLKQIPSAQTQSKSKK